jgi:lysozyme
MIDLAKMTAELTREEGVRLVVYDDATGEPIETGSRVIGNPTIGIGRCIDRKSGINRAEAQYLLQNDIAVRLAQLVALPWFCAMPSDRRRAVVNMAFQMGVAGVQHFAGMIAAIQIGNYQAAAEAALESEWARQTPTRAQRVAALLRDGDGASETV